MSGKIVNYRGQRYTMAKLALHTGVPYDTLRTRLNAGWSAEDAVSHPMPKKEETSIPAELKGKELIVSFAETLPSVYAQMQPLMGKQYVARPCISSHPTSKIRLSYIITLENGKPLIVYPDEFTIIGPYLEGGPHADS